ncbi:hypothetical protein [Dongia sp.]|uniref:hypothetical protein n=1 Tax=Dongia sp. TaxID=1977262 RepID=UPI0035B0F8E7
MPAKAYLRAIALSSLLGFSAPTQAQDSSPTAAPSNWPCEQVLRPEISLGAIWSGPGLADATETWRNVPAVATLVAQVAPRRTPQDDAVAALHRFAAGYTKDRQHVMIQVLAGLFDTMNRERRDIIRGIRRFTERQDSLSQRIEEGWRILDNLDPSSTDPVIAEQRFSLQQAIDWDSRVFDDRQKLLPEICQQPVIIEQRLFTLSRAIQEDISAGQ